MSRPEEVVFFVDYCLGVKAVPEALSALRLRVEVHQDHFPNDAPDTAWIPEVARRGWLILTKDRRVRHRPIETAALRVHGAAAFILGAGDLPGTAQAEAFGLAAPKIQRIALKCAPGDRDRDARRSRQRPGGRAARVRK